MTDGGPEPSRKRWNDIKLSAFTIAVTVTILAAAAFVVVSLLTL